MFKDVKVGGSMIDKKSFLETVKNFSREDFKEYLYRDINKKRKLLTIAIKVDDGDKDYYLNLIKNN
jgi:ribosomal protein L20A (L18A)